MKYMAVTEDLQKDIVVDVEDLQTPTVLAKYRETDTIHCPCGGKYQIRTYLSGYMKGKTVSGLTNHEVTAKHGNYLESIGQKKLLKGTDWFTVTCQCGGSYRDKIYSGNGRQYNGSFKDKHEKTYEHMSTMGTL